MTAPNSASTPATCAQARHRVCCRWHAWQSRCLSKPSPAFPLHREMLMLLPKPCAGKLILPRALGTAQLWGATSRGLCRPELLLHFNKGLKTMPPLPLPKNVVGFFYSSWTSSLPRSEHTSAPTRRDALGKDQTPVGASAWRVLPPSYQGKNTNQNVFYVHQNTACAHEDVVLHWLTAVKGLTTRKYTSVLGSKLI